VVYLQDLLFPLRRQFIKNANWRAVYIAEYMYSAGLAMSPSAILAPGKIFKRVFASMDPDLVFGWVCANITDLEDH
jgi:hypothetical protein